MGLSDCLIVPLVLSLVLLNAVYCDEQANYNCSQYEDRVMNASVTAETIMSGGILIEISSGNFRDLVVQFSIQLASVNGSTEPNWIDSKDICEHESIDTVLMCLTPPISSTTQGSGGTEKLEGTPGLLIDGQHCELSGLIFIYPDPYFLHISPYNMTYNQASPKHISIQMRETKLGFKAGDVSVMIGRKDQKSAGECEELNVTDNTISCLPPQISPDVILYESTDEYTLPVLVRVGNSNTTEVGNLLYEDKGFPIIIVIMIIILGLIILVSLFIGLLTLCRCGCCGGGSGSTKQPLVFDAYETQQPVEETGYMSTQHVKKSRSGTKLSFEEAGSEAGPGTYTSLRGGVEGGAYNEAY